MQFHTLIIILLLTFAYGMDRKIHPILNPDCSYCSNDTILYYIKAVGEKDTIHQLWDFTRGVPTVMYAIANGSSNLKVEWAANKPISFNIDPEPTYKFAAAIDKIYNYNDVNDKGYMDKKYKRIGYNLKDVHWEVNASTVSDAEAMLKVSSKNWTQGVVEIKLDLLPYSGYAAELPHLMHSANSSQVDVALVNLTGDAMRHNQSRFALGVLVASSDPPSASMLSNMRKSLDDEHTPGVFEIIEIETPATSERGDGGFVQFRPVAYTQRKRSVESSTNVHLSELSKTELPHGSTLRKFFDGYFARSGAGEARRELLVEAMFISFGEPNDGFYKAYNFTSWSFTCGYGAPPREGFSLFVILVITIGLGAPVLLALSGVAYVVARRLRQRRHPPLPLEEDDDE